MDTATTVEKGHGRRERRTLTATTALNAYLDWPGVGQVGAGLVTPPAEIFPQALAALAAKV